MAHSLRGQRFCQGSNGVRGVVVKKRLRRSMELILEEDRSHG